MLFDSIVILSLFDLKLLSYVIVSLPQSFVLRLQHRHTVLGLDMNIPEVGIFSLELLSIVFCH